MEQQGPEPQRPRAYHVHTNRRKGRNGSTSLRARGQPGEEVEVEGQEEGQGGPHQGQPQGARGQQEQLQGRGGPLLCDPTAA